jgi:hypothetical protein
MTSGSPAPAPRTSRRRVSARAARTAFSFLCLALSSAGIAAAQAAVAESDRQARMEIEATVPLSGPLRLLLGTELRMAEEPRNSQLLAEIGVELPWRIGRALSVVPRYEFHAIDEFAEPDVSEHRFTMETQLRGAAGSLGVRSRGRLELRLLEDGHRTVYRNRLRVQHPLRVASRDVTAFASTEPYLDLDRGRWLRSRFAAGGAWEVGRWMEAEAYYMLQRDFAGRVRDHHILALEIEIDLP